MTEDEEIMKKMWAIPLFDYVEDFNRRNSEVQVVCDPSNVMHYVHLHFRPAEDKEDLLANILFMAITHEREYNLSGYFSIRPVEFLPAPENKAAARRIAAKFFRERFFETDEDLERVSHVTPSPLPHLVHRYFNYMDIHNFSVSEFHFRPRKISDFRQNTLEAELQRFRAIVQQEAGA